MVDTDFGRSRSGLLNADGVWAVAELGSRMLRRECEVDLVQRLMSRAAEEEALHGD